MKAKKYKTKWNLKLLYKSDNEVQIEKDLKAIEGVCAAFERKYKDNDFTSSPEKLAKALADNERLSEVFNGAKPWWYFALKTSLDSNDDKSNALVTKFDQRITIAKNKLKFFLLKIGQISHSKQKTFLTHKLLTPFKYELERIFKSARYRLTEKEEQLASLLSQTSYDMWVDGQEKVLYKNSISYKGKSISLPEASNILYDLPKKERMDLYPRIVNVRKSASDFAEAEINAVYNYKKVMDVRRGYKNPYSATVLNHENEEKSVENLVSLISKNFKISQRFYKLHAKLLGQKRISLADLGVKVEQIKKKFPFDDAVWVVRNALGRVDKEFANILDQFVTNGQIDVYPRKGKQGGAFCWGMSTLPTFVLLNHVDSVYSVETFGHEMGHAIHTEMSKKNPPRYRKYSIATAEVASTFFEQVTNEEIEKQLTDKEKLIMLHNRIMGDMATIFHQIACFNFENELHNLIRSEGQLSKQRIANLMSKHLKSYIGDVLDINEDDGYNFVSWSHIRRFFYVYSYAYGQIISKTLFANWKKDPSYSEKIKKFLSAGRSMSPEDIFKSIGIDTSKTKFFEAGLRAIEQDIDRLEKLSKIK